MNKPRYPSLYQINTRVWVTEISEKPGRKATLDDIPDNELDRLAELVSAYTCRCNLSMVPLPVHPVQVIPYWVKNHEIHNAKNRNEEQYCL